MLSLLKSFERLKGFPIAKYEIIKGNSDLSKIKVPFWLKADVEGHKLEQKAIMHVNNLKEAEASLKKLRKKFPTSSIIAQESVEGIEIIIGIKQDPVFQKLLLVGFGGTYAEIARDISFRALPVEKKEIERMISELKLYKMLASREKYSIPSLVSLAEKVSELDVKEMDLNPVILNEKGAFIVDARIM